MKILVCTDGSEQAERAVRMACELAIPGDAQVTLLGIQEAAGQSDLILTALRRSQQLLADRKIDAELVAKSGDPVEEIVKRTEEGAFDLVVIGAVRKGHQAPFSMSAKAYKIVKLIKPPVLVVVGHRPSLKRILVCSGGKGYIESAFELVAKVARATSAVVVLLHVLPQPPAIYSHIGRMEQDLERVINSNSELGRNLRREKQLLTSLGVSIEIRLRHGFVLEEIFREIHSGDYDLLVAGSSLSTGPLRTYVLGNVTREIVNRADCPILIARHTAKPRNLRARLKDLIHGFSFGPASAENVKTISS